MQLNYIFFQSLPFPQFPSQPKQTSQRLTQIKECGTSQSLMEAISLVLWHFIWVNRGSKKWKVTDNYLTLRISFCFFDSCNFCPQWPFLFEAQSLKAQYNKCLNQIQLFRGKNKLNKLCPILKYVSSKTCSFMILGPRQLQKVIQSKFKREWGGLPVRER